MRAPDISIPPNDTVEQDGGVKWPVYYSESDEHDYTILTSTGKDTLLTPGQQLTVLMNTYRLAEMSGSTALAGAGVETASQIRKFLGQGREATVYSMGPYAVREQYGLGNFYSSLGDLQSMAALNGIIEGGTPRWLNLPAHYLTQSDPSTQRVYTIMDRVDGGLTVEDVESYPALPEGRNQMDVATFRRMVLETFGDGLQQAQEQVPALYSMAHGILASSIMARGRDPGSYLTDWKPRNVLVEPLNTPIAGSNFRLQVIDQYKK